MALRSLATEFERRNSEQFDDDMIGHGITQENAHDAFLQAAGELFCDGVNWGRVVALFVFSGRFAVFCCEKNMCDIVENIVDWVSKYIDRKLNVWIEKHDGWNGLLQFYDGSTTCSSKNQRWPIFLMLSGTAFVAFVCFIRYRIQISHKYL